MVRNLLSQFKETQLYHISRKDNQGADALAQATVEGKMEAEIMITAATLKSPRFEGMESLEPIDIFLKVNFQLVSTKNNEGDSSRKQAHFYG